MLTRESQSRLITEELTSRELVLFIRCGEDGELTEDEQREAYAAIERVTRSEREYTKTLPRGSGVAGGVCKRFPA